MKKRISKEVDLDVVDLAMLDLLQRDASLSTAELSERLSLSATPCWRRRKRLEEEGYIENYQANLDRHMLGLHILAFVEVRFASHAEGASDRFEELVATLPEVLSCHKVTGEADFLLQVLETDLDAYSDFVENVLRKQPGIASIQSTLALREIKSTRRILVPR